MTTTKRSARCSRCQARVPKAGKMCDRCRSYDLAKREDAKRRIQLAKAAEEARLSAIRATMTPILGNDGTEVGYDGFTNVKKKQVGWRCKRCGAACAKRSCLLCERSVV